MREIRTLRATWRGLETWGGSGPPGHTGAPALDPTDERCALKAHVTQSPGMAAAAKISQQPRTESCVVSGNGHCEA